MTAEYSTSVPCRHAPASGISHRRAGPACPRGRAGPKCPCRPCDSAPLPLHRGAAGSQARLKDRKRGKLDVRFVYHYSYGNLTSGFVTYSKAAIKCFRAICTADYRPAVQMTQTKSVGITTCANLSVAQVAFSTDFSFPRPPRRTAQTKSGERTDLRKSARPNLTRLGPSKSTRRYRTRNQPPHKRASSRTAPHGRSPRSGPCRPRAASIGAPTAAPQGQAHRTAARRAARPRSTAARP